MNKILIKAIALAILNFPQMFSCEANPRVKLLEEHATIALKFYKKINLNFDIEMEPIHLPQKTELSINSVWKNELENIIKNCPNINENPNSINYFLKINSLIIAIFLNNLGYKLPDFLGSDSNENIIENHREELIKSLSHKVFINICINTSKETLKLNIDEETSKILKSSKELYENFIEFYSGVKSFEPILDKTVDETLENITEIYQQNNESNFISPDKIRSFEIKLKLNMQLLAKMIISDIKNYLCKKFRTRWLVELQNPENLNSIFESNSKNIKKFEILLKDIEKQYYKIYFSEEDNQKIDEALTEF